MTSQPGYVVIINDDATEWKVTTMTFDKGHLKNKTLKAYVWSSSEREQNYAPDNQF